MIAVSLPRRESLTSKGEVDIQVENIDLIKKEEVSIATSERNPPLICYNRHLFYTALC